MSKLTNPMLIKSFHMMLHISSSEDTTVYVWVQSLHTAIKLFEKKKQNERQVLIYQTQLHNH